MSTVGIRKVAEEAGVSIGTVSKILNPTSGANIRVSEETRAKVLTAAGKLHYRPSYGARLLRGESTRMIGFAVSLPGEHTDAYLSSYSFRLLNGIGKAVSANGYQLQILNGVDYRYYMDVKRLDALVMLSFSLKNNPREQEMREMFTRFNENSYPYAVINPHGETTLDGTPVAGIGVDNEEGMRLLADLLIRKGVVDIAYLGELTPNPQLDHILRCNLLKRYLAGSCVRFEDSLILNGCGDGIPEVPRIGRYSHIDGMTAVRRLHEQNRLPRCLVCGNDDIAQGALRALWELKISVPDQVAVVGHDDSFCDYSAPGLTTIRQPLEEMGELAVQNLLQKMDHPESAFNTLLKPTLMERETL